MAATLPTDAREVIGLGDLVRFLDERIDVDDAASLCSAAPMLRALANNRAFLADLVANELAEPELFQADNNYFSRALVLYSNERYAIRAAVWLPEGAADSTPTAVDEDGALVGLGNSIYGLVHNHAFPFLTVGYWGPGYSTTIYECDGNRHREIGDAASLRLLEHTSLPVGKVMYYRAFDDVHSQEPPPATSISLNILVNNDAQTLEDQYDFDAASGRVAGVVGQGNDARGTLCWMAAELCGGETRDLLQAIATQHPSLRVRADAARAAQRIDERVAATDDDASR